MLIYSFVVQRKVLVANWPRYDVLLKHQFVQTTEADHDTDVGAWYQSVLEQAKELNTANQQ